MRLFTAYWNKEEEGEVRWSDNFQNENWVLKADALQDVIYILQAEHEKIFLDLDNFERQK